MGLCSARRSLGEPADADCATVLVGSIGSAVSIGEVDNRSEFICLMLGQRAMIPTVNATAEAAMPAICLVIRARVSVLVLCPLVPYRCALRCWVERVMR